MQTDTWQRLRRKVYNLVLSVPVSIKIAGIMMLTVLILGYSLNYWITTGLSDWLSYLLTDVRVEAAMAAGRRSVTLVTILAALASIFPAMLLTYLLTRPLHELRKMATQVAEGELTARAPVYSNDEIGEVATAVNTMTNHLVQAQTDLTRSNRRLSAINHVIQAANRESEIHDVLYAILGTVLDVLNLESGWIYLRDPDRDQFHLASWRNIQPEVGKQLLHAPQGELCECQRKLLAGELTVGVNSCACARLTAYLPPAQQATHLTLAIEAGPQRLGVINLLCTEAHQLSDDDLDLLPAISAQVSEIVANAWLRLKLAEKEKARQYLLESLVEAQDEERSRLARELHDGAGQMLTTLLVRLKTLERQSATTPLQHGLASSLDLVSETIEQVRDLSYRLRPAALEEFGLTVALRTLVAETLEDAGIATRYQADLGDTVLPHSVEVSLYRIAQEALTNVLRHAQAQTVIVELARHSGVISLRIRDDGVGFVPHQTAAQDGKHHLGLVSMAERARMVGGTFNVDSVPGKGTTIQVYVPLQESAGA